MSANNPEEEKEHSLMMARGDSDGNYSPSRKLGSIVLGDGSFEALMKERSKVSSAVPLIYTQIQLIAKYIIL